MKSKAALILIRHAHRDLHDRALDNGLSLKGRKQASELEAYLEKLDYPRDAIRVYSSERLRCRETVEGFAERMRTEIRISGLLLEQEEGEKDPAFEERIKEFLKKARKKISEKQRVIVACSHGDWLPIALLESTGARVDFVKGAAAELVIGEDGKWVLTSFFRPSAG